jgi:hypothetical protein
VLLSGRVKVNKVMRIMRIIREKVKKFRIKVKYIRTMKISTLLGLGNHIFDYFEYFLLSISLNIYMDV